MKIAAAYIRVSTEDQVEYSPDSQVKAIQKYAKANEIILPEEFIFMDEGISGRKADKRPAFQRMIGTAKMKPKPFDVILLWKFSRFARNREDSIVYKSMLRKQCGIDVISISEQLGEDKTSILIEALIEAMDEYYSINLAEEVRRGMNEKFSRGGVVSQPPFGYKMGDERFVPDEARAVIVRMIFDDFITGSSLRQIAYKLNCMGVRSTKGNVFENRTVEYILTNPAYIGKLRRSLNGRDNSDRFHQSMENTIFVNGKQEPIVDEDTFSKAQKLIAKNKAMYPRYSRQEPAEYMLKGLVRCDKCGSTLTFQRANDSLQCHSYSKGSCGVSHGIRIDKINAAVIEKLKQDFKSGSFIYTVCKSENKCEVSATETILKNERRKLDRIRDAYESGIDTIDEYRENKEKIMKRIDELSKTIIVTHQKSPEEMRLEIIGKIKNSIKIIDDPDTSEHLKNITLRSLIDQIIFIKPQGIIEIHYKV